MQTSIYDFLYINQSNWNLATQRAQDWRYFISASVAEEVGKVPACKPAERKSRALLQRREEQRAGCKMQGQILVPRRACCPSSCSSVQGSLLVAPRVPLRAGKP